VTGERGVRCVVRWTRPVRAVMFVHCDVVAIEWAFTLVRQTAVRV
jgi:hypothetical protein